MLNDPLLFQATTTYAAARLDCLHEKQEQPRTLTKKAHTIKMVNEELRRTSNAASNSILGAVVMLANVEVCEPSN